MKESYSHSDLWIKVHKENVLLRPIINTIGSPTYKLANFLARKLKCLAENTNLFIRDSTKMVEEIKFMSWEDEDMLVTLHKIVDR